MTFDPPLRILRNLTASLSLAAAFPGLAQADLVKLRMAHLMADAMLPILAAKDAGAFEQAGIDLEVTEAQGGPAVVAAIAAGEADIGYSAAVPPINARLNGLPVKMVLALGQELDADTSSTWIVASKASGIADIAGLKGHNVAINANGSGCDLALRDHLAAAGLKPEDVNVVVLPFPSQEAALQQGAIDAACTISPFYASMLHNSDIAPLTLSSGVLADQSTPTLSDVVYTTDDFLAQNKDALVAFAKVVETARTAMLDDRAATEAAAQKYLGLTAEAAKDFKLPVLKGTTVIDPAEVQWLLDAMKRDGLLSADVTSADLSATLE